MDWLERNWRDCAKRLGFREEMAALSWTMLTALYAGRAYHSLNHAGDCVALLHRMHREMDVPDGTGHRDGAVVA